MPGALIAAVLIVCAPLALASPDDSDIDVKIERSSTGMIVDVVLRVQASPQDAWKVLTDYDAMARFVSTLESSTIDTRSDNELHVTQRGAVQFGLFRIPFTTVRRIELVPYSEIRTYVIDGSMKSSRFTTTLVPLGDSTQIIQHGDAHPDIWIPPGIGPALIAAGTRKQWQEFRVEILRRSGIANARATETLR